MIRYALKCAEGHSFESWFQSAAAFDTLVEKGMMACAICGSVDVSKALMAPRVSATEEGPRARDGEGAVPDRPLERPLSEPTHPAEAFLRAMREHVEKNSTYVGGNFAKQAVPCIWAMRPRSQSTERPSPKRRAR